MGLLGGMLRRMRYWRLKKQQIYIDGKADVTDCTFEAGPAYNYIRRDSFVMHCSIGRGTYIRDHCYFKNASIGRFCSIAPDVKMVYGEHPTRRFVSIHPAFYSKDAVAGLSFGHDAGFEKYKTTPEGFYCKIGNDVWIASGARLMGGITIGDGAIIGCGSLVTKDVPPYAIVAGVPARVIRYRFPQEQRERLLQFQWWHKDIAWIRENIQYFDDIDAFCESMARDGKQEK